MKHALKIKVVLYYMFIAIMNFARLNKSSKSFYMTKNLRLEWLTCPVKCYGELRSLPGRKINSNGPSVELSLRVEEQRLVKSKKYLHMNDLNKAIKVKSNVLWPELRL